MHTTNMANNSASSSGQYFNTGNGPTIQFIEIEHPDYVALLDPDTAFWSLLRKEKISEALDESGSLIQEFRKKRETFAQEMELLRFGLKPSAVYFNPTERCNLNCSYCYIPEELRKSGSQMTREELIRALDILKEYFRSTLPEGRLPQVVFHGSEPMLARDAVFAGITKYKDDFSFGIQTNATLLDDESIEFLTSRNVGIGLSLDGHEAAVANLTRKNWAGEGFFEKTVTVLERLKGYPNYNVICTVTSRNTESLTDMVNFLHEMEVPIGMLNPVRCTRQGARDIKPRDAEMSPHYLKALDRTYELYQKTGRKLVIANFANVLIGIVAPLARRLMCDISPCGGGRCFFAVGAKGDLFPCSEFVGVPEFNGGNLFRDNISDVLETRAFKSVTGRKVEEIGPCAVCAIRHFCGSPCPAEAYEMNGGMNRPGAFCELYEDQVRYAMRLIADGKENTFLWDGWDSGTSTTLEITSL
ncbi:peptide-modifying radical SAM enzyme CbpB [Desulfomonile tiedjei]|uniref:Radical SAM additional 4Fe4S-binding domain protein n=1 Tax=Desulfomonile tiedjei (strain ATCC 49306 / DSM 6799 / DCB-1) TaxID=706587 RepID=I4C029_DESTA|nr:peptide-modifying radical SAM enzyme CbpB [Desulfomonile tiedjei]AFM22920.1 radical SAM additional 4Fe4S-binding domain protein [Desulfomonile tiedjei DSM 6799]